MVLEGITDLATQRASYPRTLAITQPWFNTLLPRAYAGEPYSYTLPAWGGTPPYTFRLESGSLPAGIDLDPATGTLSGAPWFAELGTENSFFIEVRDSSVTRHNGGPQIAVKQLSFWTVPEPGSFAGLVAGILMLRLLARRRM